MKKTILTSVLAGVLLMAAIAVGQAGPGRARGIGDCRFDGPWMGKSMPRGHGDYRPHGIGMGPGFGFESGGPGMAYLVRFKDELGLTEAQIDQMKKLQYDFQMERIDKKAELQKVQIRLGDLLTDENAQESTVFSAIDDAARLRAELHKMRYRHHKQARDLLTDEQLDKLEELHLNRGARFFDDDDNDFPRRGRNR